jgi:hypothetical protein
VLEGSRSLPVPLLKAVVALTGAADKLVVALDPFPGESYLALDRAARCSPGVVDAGAGNLGTGHGAGSIQRAIAPDSVRRLGDAQRGHLQAARVRLMRPAPAANKVVWMLT